jgi:uncharacterized protein
MARKILARVARFARHRYYVVFALVAALVLTSALLCSRIRFDTDVLHLLPQNDPHVQVFRETLANFGNVDYLLIAVRVPEGAVLDPYQTFVRQLGERLTGLSSLHDVSWGLGDPEELVRTFFPKAMLFLDEQNRGEVARRLSDEGIRRHVEEMRRQLATPQAMALKNYAKLDPLGIADLFLSKMSADRGAVRADLASGFYLSRDHRMLLILAKPNRPAQDLGFVRGMVAEIDAIAAELLTSWPRIAGEGGPPAPSVDLGGGHVIALSDSALIQREVVLNLVSSLIGVLLLFLFAFRRLASLAYAFLPLAVGLVLTFGFAAIVFGTLSSATSGIAALVLGLGIDFVIVCYGRYVEERRNGVDVETALESMVSTSGWAVVVGATTTAATFYAFTFTDFVGLRQMGILTGTGILLCLVFVLLLLPALLAWSEDHHRKRDSAPKLYLHGFGAEHLMRVCHRQPRKVLALAGVVTLVSLFLIPRIEFQEAMESMRPRGKNRGFMVRDEVSHHFGSGFNFMTMVVSGSTAEEVVELSERTVTGAGSMVEQEILSGVDGVSSLVPARRQQDAALAWLASGRANGDLDPHRIRSTFELAVAAEGMRLTPFLPGLELLTTALRPAGPIRTADFANSPTSARLIERYLKATPNGWQAAVYLYPPQNKWRREAPPQAIQLAAELGPRAALTGINVVSASLRRQAKRDAALAGGIGLLLVLLLLWLDYRDVRPALLSLLPLAMGVVWMLGAMAMFGIDMNFMNIFVSTMVIGIGTDYGVHIVHRSRELRQCGAAETEVALGETGKAVVLAALTTMVGFGSLSLSQYPGLRSLGFVAALGTLFTCLLALTLLPALLSLRRQAGEEVGTR